MPTYFLFCCSLLFGLSNIEPFDTNMYIIFFYYTLRALDNGVSLEIHDNIRLIDDCFHIFWHWHWWDSMETPSPYIVVVYLLTNGLTYKYLIIVPFAVHLNEFKP